MSPKKRLKENQPLPKRWKWQHGAIYYLVPPAEKHIWDNKSWFRLGTTKAEAYRTFSERLNNNKTIEVVLMAELLDLFEAIRLPELAPATQKYYTYALPMVRKVFATNPVPVAAVEPQHAYQMSDYLERTESKKKAKQAAECLSASLSFAVKRGIIKINPLIGQFKKPSTEGREREVSNEELIAFAMTLPRKWQLYISLKLHTHGRRKGELLRIYRRHVTSEGIEFTNNKRKKDRFIVGWTDELRWIVDEIVKEHPPVTGDCPLFFSGDKEPYIKEDGTTSGFDTMWQRHMRAAIANKVITERFTEHDIRSKAVEDFDLHTASRYLRHVNPSTTSKHYRVKPEKL